jgi:ABC-type protease/lipase transport system fused ATPase/permease subunit
VIGFDIPWWVVALIFLYVLVVYFGIGAVCGFILTYALLARAAGSGTSAPKSRSDRIGLSLLAALTGGALNFLVAWLIC